MGHICTKIEGTKKVDPEPSQPAAPVTAAAVADVAPVDAKPQETAVVVTELKDKKVIFVLGGPGSGKGTVCARLVNDYGLKHLSAGDLLREEVKERPESDLSKEIQNHMKEGTLVPATVIVPLLKAKIASSEAAGFLVDGFPREPSQAELFEGEIVTPVHVLFLECSEETMMARLLKRAETSGRVDDNAETIKKRFETFQNQSLPVVEHYAKKDLVSKIDGNGTPDEAYALVQAAMDKVMPKKA